MGTSGQRGSGPDDAIVIDAQNSLEGIPLENRALSELLEERGQHWHKEGQALVTHQERQYDVIRVRFADDTTREVWFDITAFFGGFGAALFGSAQAEAQQPTLPPFPREIEDDIAEAVVRHQLREFRGEVAFLIYRHPGEEETDPSDAFLARFAGHQPPVRKESASTVAVPNEESPRRSFWQRLLGKAPPPAPPRSFYDRQPRIVERTTGKTGTKFRIDTIKRLADDRADVEGGWYAGPGAAWDGLFHLELGEDELWFVKKTATRARL